MDPVHAKDWDKLTEAEKAKWYESVDRLRRAAKANKSFYFQALVTPNEVVQARINTAIKILTDLTEA
jgi:N-acetyl-anhydromuramyl-L-alanine amidase AmpD